MKTNRAIPKPRVHTHEGGRAVVNTSPIMELRRATLACLLWEDTFYESGSALAQRIDALVPQCSYTDLQDLVLESRELMHLRHVPLYLVNQMLKVPAFKSLGLKNLIARVVQRADEITELLAMYWKDAPGAPLAFQLKEGLKHALNKFTAWELAKYNGKAQVRLRDALFMVHAKPVTNVLAGEFPGDGALVPAIKRGKRKLDPLLKGGVDAYVRGPVRRHTGHHFTRLANDSLESPDTWEVALSAGKDKKTTFSQLLEEHKLGGLALLRNLRGMVDAGVDTQLIQRAISTHPFTRVLPFRFITALKHAPQFGGFLEAAMLRACQGLPKLPGTTIIVVDGSGSMTDKVSGKSELTRFDAAVAMAMLAKEQCEDARVFFFNRTCQEVGTYARGFALKDAAELKGFPSGGTFLGQAITYARDKVGGFARIIVLTDEQSQDEVGAPGGRGYMVNLATFENGVGYGPWVRINGWSEHVLRFILAVEGEKDL